MKKGVWRYTASLEVESEENIQKGMVLIELPSTKYAVFEYHGAIGPELGRKFEYIYKEWLPASEYEKPPRMTMRNMMSDSKALIIKIQF